MLKTMMNSKATVVWNKNKILVTCFEQAVLKNHHGELKKSEVFF